MSSMLWGGWNYWCHRSRLSFLRINASWRRCCKSIFFFHALGGYPGTKIKLKLEVELCLWSVSLNKEVGRRKNSNSSKAVGQSLKNLDSDQMLLLRKKLSLINILGQTLILRRRQLWFSWQKRVGNTGCLLYDRNQVTALTNFWPP